ncbi:MAG: abc transporter [Lasallia pustulata]|uniref:Abc transporter n=1 Tax=Lasallia pustulata TaxID=136370 RepID=A0A5M8PUP9_9LECA|nr:MAG: abc transporter [Lasallia pustulata]
MSATTATKGLAGDFESAKDAEKGSDVYLLNDAVHTFSWQSISVKVPDRDTKGEKTILCNVSGNVKAGEMIALMGPSGSGKTTLLNVLAHRAASAKATVEGTMLVNGATPSISVFKRASGYVEQEDSLIGSLTARETLDFAARLALPSTVTKAERRRRVDGLISAFGLQDQANTILGTPIRKGLSGGQVRRVGVASQLITCPKILFLDEPTSGLDSRASYEVISYLKKVVKKNNLIVIASIHQPSTSTFAAFDKLFLLSAGKLCYAGPVTEIPAYFQSIGFPMPLQINPAEWLLDLVNVDFARGDAAADERLATISAAWGRSPKSLDMISAANSTPNQEYEALRVDGRSGTTQLFIPITLLHRNFIKSYRDVVTYGIRFAMYTGLAIMMGTVWLRLGTTQENIQPFVNAIFFGSAFMSFMAVAYVPAFLEDRATFSKENANGLYGPSSFLIANFLIGLPYLFLISLLFSIIAYWLSNFRPTGTAFMTWVMWLFLDLLAAESLVVLVSSLFPTFVVALALTAFANGLWMSVGGFLVSPKVINVFWRYWARYIDYQSYVFQGMMVNEFASRSYSCAGGFNPATCTCMYQTPLASQCRISGQGVLDTYGYKTGKTGEWVGILLAIVLAYRLLTWVVLRLRS